LNDYLLAAILGVIEGLTEFLPVSSTAHLRIFQAWVGIDLADGYWKMFSIVIQAGAILSLPIYFRRTLAEFLAHFPRGPRGDRTLLTHPLSLILVAFVCTAVPTLLLTRMIGENLESLTVMGAALVMGGVVMWAVDAFCSAPGRSPQTRRLDETGLGQSVWIGLCQAISAVFPGTSRSMATIAAGQLAGMSRPVALEFSFLLSIPTMIGATGFDLLQGLWPEQEANPLGAVAPDSRGILLLLIGGVVSFVVAYLSVAWFMQWVRRHGFALFAIYRILCGAVVLLLAARQP
jgi:undecaprenyl-diphosphatase